MDGSDRAPLVKQQNASRGEVTGIRLIQKQVALKQSDRPLLLLNQQPASGRWLNNNIGTSTTRSPTIPRGNGILAATAHQTLSRQLPHDHQILHSSHK
jgi:hypothetical protein